MCGRINNKAKVFRHRTVELNLFIYFSARIFLNRRPMFPVVKDLNYIIESGSLLMNGIERLPNYI